jgi:hypothetical protein
MASFDRTKCLLANHASSFTASQKAELREVLGTLSTAEATQSLIEGTAPAST